MSDDNLNNDDDLKSSSHPTLQISTPEKADQFKEEMEKIKLAEKEIEVAAKAEKLGLPYIELGKLAILPEAISVISEEDARLAQTVCFDKKEDNIKIAAVNPTSPELQKLTQKLTDNQYKTDLFLISPHSFEKSLYFYKAVPKIKEIIRGVTISEEDLKKYSGQFTDFQVLAKKIRKVSTTDLIAFIIASAIDGRASDIHIEAEERGIMIRYRIDGVLHEIVDLPKETWKKLNSRIKLIARLKINVSDKPQDGGFSINLSQEKIDVRVSTIPTNYGESIVMRLLMSSVTSIQFDSLGIRGKAFVDLDRELKKPNGMIITTGPTGSGKTTTLYAILNRLNDKETKIITLEDPIEYKLEGINQSQIDASKDYGFASGLRSILRQDPDIIMVGEIRDLETAETAINAALTGHLVISTLHTNSAAATVPRFLAMEVKPFLLAPALNAIIGQRLVRKICPDCKMEIETDNQTMSKIIEILSTLKPESGEKTKIPDINNLKFFKGKGCDKCQGLGYKGRIGIYEIMSMSQDVENIILSGKVSEYQLQEIALKQGMVTMVQDGLLKAVDGITTVDEVFRVSK